VRRNYDYFLIITFLALCLCRGETNSRGLNAIAVGVVQEKAKHGFIRTPECYSTSVMKL